MSDVARERFVPQAVATLAYMDSAVPLHPVIRHAPVRSLMPPRTFAKLVQLAEVDGADAVLIVGAGMGYSSAILTRIAGRVVALESDEALFAHATTALADVPNLTLVDGPLIEGAVGKGPFQVIIVEGTVWERPDGLLAQLAPGGRLVAVLNDGGVGRATVWRRVGNHYGVTSSFEAVVGPLPGFERATPFVF